MLQLNRYVNNLFDPDKKSIRNLIANLRQTCRASAGDVVTDKSLPADSPQCERVAGSGRQTVHCRSVRCNWRRLWVANKTIACRWLCMCPRKRQRSSRWAGERALSVNFWRYVIHTRTASLSKRTILVSSLHTFTPRRLKVNYRRVYFAVF